MSRRGALIALLATVASSRLHAQPSTSQPHATPAKPTEATCRTYVEQGLAKTNPDEARELFHAARVRCANPLSLVYIARTYEQQGDLPRALAYLEEFLSVVDQNHDSRAAVEQMAAALRERVPAEQRIIAAELAEKSGTPVAATFETEKMRLNRQVEDADYQTGTSRDDRTSERASGFFVGTNFAYAAKATVEVRTDTMVGKVDFPAVFAAEVQAGYRLFPFLSVALASEMLFNLKPKQEPAANEVGVFAQTIGHLVLRPQWDFNVLVAPGYSVVIVPGADNAKGLAFRWGGGPMFHLTEHISFAVEFSHQIGFQTVEHDAGDVDMSTSFVSLLAGIRVRQ